MFEYYFMNYYLPVAIASTFFWTVKFMKPYYMAVRESLPASRIQRIAPAGKLGLSFVLAWAVATALAPLVAFEVVQNIIKNKRGKNGHGKLDQ